MEQVSIIAALTAGIISFLSPCVLPLVPAYISFISGVSLEELKQGQDRSKILMRVSIRMAVFIMGFSLVFILLGASATFIGNFLLTRMHVLSKIAGVVIVIFGLHLVGIYRLNFLNYERRFQVTGKALNTFTILVLGMAFAFGWTPCIGPILAAILTLAATQQTIMQGVVLLGVYSIGLGIPFFLTGLAISSFLGLFQWFRKYFRLIEVISGIFLIILGVMIFFDMFMRLSGYFMKWFPFLQNIG